MNQQKTFFKFRILTAIFTFVVLFAFSVGTSFFVSTISLSKNEDAQFEATICDTLQEFPDLPKSIQDINHWYFGDGTLGENRIDRIDLMKLKTDYVAKWKQEIAGRGVEIDPVVIAVIDTGCDLSHELISSVLLKDQNGDIVAYNSNSGKETLDAVDDTEGHGTHVAGIIATQIIALGLQDYVKIVPIKGINSNRQFMMNDTISAIQWATGGNKRGFVADVVNMSYGILGKSASWQNTDPLENLIAEKSDKTVFVAAAGNSQTNSSITKFYPAALKNVVGVMNFGKTSGGEPILSSTSNYGDVYDLAAPGEFVYSSINSLSNSAYEYKSGTSMASPFVAFGIGMMNLRFQMPSELTKIDMPSLSAKQVSKLFLEHTNESQTISKSSYKIRTYSLTNAMSKQFSAEDVLYLAPNKVSTRAYLVSNDSVETENHISQVLGENVKYNLRATISPVGEYDPTYDTKINWYLVKIVDSASGKEESEGGEIVKTKLGSGKNLVLSNKIADGEFNVYAELPYAGAVIKSAPIKLYVQAQRPAFENIWVVPNNNFSYQGKGNDLKLRVGQTMNLSLSGIENIGAGHTYAWYVNGEKVSTEKNFSFTPQQKGTFEIVARIDGLLVYHPFTLTVQTAPYLYWVLALLSLFGFVAVILAIAIPVKKRKIENQKFEESINRSGDIDSEIRKAIQQKQKLLQEKNKNENKNGNKTVNNFEKVAKENVKKNKSIKQNKKK